MFEIDYFPLFQILQNQWTLLVDQKGRIVKDLGVANSFVYTHTHSRKYNMNSANVAR